MGQSALAPLTFQCLKMANRPTKKNKTIRGKRVKLDPKNGQFHKFGIKFGADKSTPKRI